ncbi:class F sortase [Candidatus Saccharibacteria bacterium]|nr:class F sortase [Candidatus Saccharibacteria bacterium]
MQVVNDARTPRLGVYASVVAGCLLVLAGVLLLGFFQTNKDVAPAGVSFRRPVSGGDIDIKDDRGVPRLDIPAIRVSSAVELVGVESNGDMAVPNNYERVGLYERGPSPGSTGNAVIAGHVNGSTLNDDGVFAKLNDLTDGDTLKYYAKDKDYPFIFQVFRIEEYKLDDFPIKEVFGSSVGKNLNLVTCSGEWDASLNTYSHRLVVYANFIE